MSDVVSSVEKEAISRFLERSKPTKCATGASGLPKYHYEWDGETNKLVNMRPLDTIPGTREFALKTSKIRRVKVDRMRKAGKQPKEIAGILKVSLTTIYNDFKELKVEGYAKPVHISAGNMGR